MTSSITAKILISLKIFCRFIARQEHAARLGHHGIDQAVHALDGLRALQRSLEFGGQFGVPPRAVDRHDGQQHGGGGEQGDDRVKLEKNGNVRPPWHLTHRHTNRN